MEQIERLREKLNLLVIESEDLYKGEILEISQQLDRLIYLQYRKVNGSEISI
ncbi:Spo0E family sporulation regulatory protein-aspartic acid phosphatase [Clostridium sp. MT-14]|jgi:hypothetical protein|uniref:Aspartyl-phosphate phosphatase Spo0E family protein n=1 Tax=Clostridium aromativorans TaxID=2836848 RepID=A0ABS8N508_9CLOT|nr:MULTISPECIES: aspartyl-phosphate phosphatase Spo0E family protein [Clostridium]KAA8674354.1 aspartyl-phosphate phosphatase Spo0E family protein [Clostridium sp. HV4-5-A1G]MCC9294881.1 aspartyl-phosphate phosphatase Spo0E family protein [Clostridium aromativorans]CAB1250330.1 hypothetical protein CLOSBL3_12070 [Clostridiaceae bacterium BL-3]